MNSRSKITGVVLVLFFGTAKYTPNTDCCILPSLLKSSKVALLYCTDQKISSFSSLLMLNTSLKAMVGFSPFMAFSAHKAALVKSLLSANVS